MTDFMAAALQLLPQPAVLFEWKEHRYVASNQPASDFCREQFGGEAVDAAEAFRRLDLNSALDAAIMMPHSTYSARRDYGVVHMSRLPTMPGRSRPDLLVLTIHADVDDKTAWLDHQRMLLSLNVNEASEIAVRVMEDQLVQISAALESQRELIATYNRRMGEFLKWNKPGIDFPGSA
jgi:hypothetical protein